MLTITHVDEAPEQSAPEDCIDRIGNSVDQFVVANNNHGGTSLVDGALYEAHVVNEEEKRMQERRPLGGRKEESAPRMAK